jgi:hypothetical protein
MTRHPGTIRTPERLRRSCGSGAPSPRRRRRRRLRRVQSRPYDLLRLTLLSRQQRPCHATVRRIRPDRVQPHGAVHNFRWPSCEIGSPLPHFLTFSLPHFLTSGNRISRIGPDHARQIVQRDSNAPPVRRRQDQQYSHDGERPQSQEAMRSAKAEVEQRDDRGDRQPIADDRERPGVARIAFVDQTTNLATVEVMPAGEKRTLTAVGTPLQQSTSESGRDQSTSRAAVHSTPFPGHGASEGTTAAAGRFPRQASEESGERLGVPRSGHSPWPWSKS